MLSLLFLLAVSSYAAGQYLFICPKPTIEAEEGDDILLQCRLDPQIDLSTHTVDCTRDNKVVRACRHGQDLPDTLDQYRGRTTLNHEDLNRGVVTLLISSAQLSDSGPYKFCVQKLACCTVNVKVVKKDQQNRTKRGDFSTSGPPVKPVTLPDNRDAAEMEAVSPKAVGGILAVVVVVGGVFSILVRRGKIRSCKRRRRDEETKPDDSEMENLKTRTTEEDEDQHSSAENGLRR